MFLSARWVAIGGILGSLLRWGLSTPLDQNQRGTLIANLLGVALASFFLVLMERHGSDAQRHFFLPGFCGGLTTFSAVTLLSLQAHSGFFIPDGPGFAYLLETIALSLLVVAICIPLSRKFISTKQ